MREQIHNCIEEDFKLTNTNDLYQKSTNTVIMYIYTSLQARHLPSVRITAKVFRGYALPAKHAIFPTTLIMVSTTLMVTTVPTNKVPTSIRRSTQAMTFLAL